MLWQKYKLEGMNKYEESAMHTVDPCNDAIFGGMF